MARRVLVFQRVSIDWKMFGNIGRSMWLLAGRKTVSSFLWNWWKLWKCLTRLEEKWFLRGETCNLSYCWMDAHGRILMFGELEHGFWFLTELVEKQRQSILRIIALKLKISKYMMKIRRNTLVGRNWKGKIYKTS